MHRPAGRIPLQVVMLPLTIITLPVEGAIEHVYLAKCSKNLALIEIVVLRMLITSPRTVIPYVIREVVVC